MTQNMNDGSEYLANYRSWWVPNWHGNILIKFYQEESEVKTNSERNIKHPLIFSVTKNQNASWDTDNSI